MLFLFAHADTINIKMEPYFDFNELKKRIKDFYTVSHIRVAVFDNSFNEVCDYPLERSPICFLMRKNEKFDNACRLCDKEHMEIASKSTTPYIYKCHAGIYEIIVPINFSGQLIGYLFFAHILNYPSHDAAWAEISKAVEAYGINALEAKEDLLHMPLFDSSYLQAASSILQAAASYLCVEHIAYLRYEDLPMKIDKYIKDNLGGNLTCKAICEQFHLGRTALYEMANRIYKEGIAEHIRVLRLAKAEEIIKEKPDIKISDLAEQVGFSDYSYFIVAFKRATGLTPHGYAMKYR
jgi:ligand-binding sensor protein